MAAQVHFLMPALNEEPRIGAVLESLCSYPQKKRIVVIDDGSTDGTGAAAAKFPIEVVQHPANMGKGAAIQTGIEHLGPTPYWVFLDADLIGLEHDHIDQLLEPLYRDRDMAMTVGMLVGAKPQVNMAQRWFGILNGQRGLAGHFVDSLPSLAWSRFGVEIFLSKYAQARRLPVRQPLLHGLTHYTKEEKLGFGPGVRSRMQMYRECIYSLFYWRRYVV